MADPAEFPRTQASDTVFELLPEHDCGLCPRLHAFRSENRKSFPDKYNAPVPSFGEKDAHLLIVGLAPGLRGANFSGRPFTGDYAGELLYGTLLKYGFARGKYQARIDDRLTLVDARITNAVKCVPPQNKPEGAEIKKCLPFLSQEIKSMHRLRAIISLGLISHNAVLKASSHKISSFKFAHGAQHKLSERITLFDSYHCSRYNTNTGRLTTEMFEDVFKSIKKLLES
ncbi:MAG: uracil-DNA glycosylase [Alphaproteobacteria bacterium]|nr:uracil-DNA glycosylase [Alphaproteobacteria bacterium]